MKPRKPSMRLFGGINTHYSLPSNPTSDRGKRQSAGLRKVSNAVGSRPWPPYSKALPGFPKTGPFHYHSNKFGSSEICLEEWTAFTGCSGSQYRLTLSTPTRTTFPATLIFDLGAIPPASGGPEGLAPW